MLIGNGVEMKYRALILECNILLRDSHRLNEGSSLLHLFLNVSSENMECATFGKQENAIGTKRRIG